MDTKLSEMETALEKKTKEVSEGEKGESNISFVFVCRLRNSLLQLRRRYPTLRRQIRVSEMQTRTYTLV